MWYNELLIFFFQLYEIDYKSFKECFFQNPILATFHLAEKALKKCISELGRGEPRLEIAADELRAALIILEGMIGSVGVEDFLDKILCWGVGLLLRISK